jgi:hypothetical protein
MTNEARDVATRPLGHPTPRRYSAPSLESVLLVLIGLALVSVAVLLLYSSMYDLNEAVHRGPGQICW